MGCEYLKGVILRKSLGSALGRIIGAWRKLLNKKRNDLECLPGQNVCYAWRGMEMHVGISWGNLKKRVYQKKYGEIRG
jgi:hypothetical protein